MEGNTLSISETKILLEDGITVGGKPIKDYYRMLYIKIQEKRGENWEK